MKKLFEITLQNRKFLYKILKDMPRNLLPGIPVGYRNNIWWNIAHVIAIQQLLVYRLSNLRLLINEDLANKFKGGTVPDSTPSEKEIKEVAAYLFSTAERTQQDYENNVFGEFKAYTTINKVTLKSVEDALAFNVFHEGLHLGVILSLQKVLMSTGSPRT